MSRTPLSHHDLNSPAARGGFIVYRALKESLMIEENPSAPNKFSNSFSLICSAISHWWTSEKMYGLGGEGVGKCPRGAKGEVRVTKGEPKGGARGAHGGGGELHPCQPHSLAGSSPSFR